MEIKNNELSVTRLKSGVEKRVYIRRDACMQANIILEEFQGPLIVYDLETSGLGKVVDRIVQIAAFKCTRGEDGKWKVTDKLNLYIRPEFDMPEEASSVNHITDEVLKNAPTEEEAFCQIDAFFGDVNHGEAVVAGYNILNFDNKVMANLYIRHGKPAFAPMFAIDVMPIAMELLDRSELRDEAFKQESVAEFMGFKEETMHNALTDTYVSGRILFALLYYYRTRKKAPHGYYAGKPRLTIVRMYARKYSKTSNYIIVDVAAMTDDGWKTGQFHYDLYNKKYVEDEGDLMEIADMPQFANDADAYAGGNIRKFGTSQKKRRKERG